MACFELPIPAIKTVVWQYNLSFCYLFITYVSPYINNLNYFSLYLFGNVSVMFLDHRNFNANTSLLSYDKYLRRNKKNNESW